MNYLFICLTILVLIILFYKIKNNIFYNLPYENLEFHNYTFQNLKNDKNMSVLRDNSFGKSTYTYNPDKKICILNDNFYVFCMTDLIRNIEFKYGKHKFTNLYCPVIIILNDNRVKKIAISFKENKTEYSIKNSKGSKIIRDVEYECCGASSSSSMEYYDRPYVQMIGENGDVIYSMLINKSNSVCFYII